MNRVEVIILKYKNFKWKFANSAMIPIGIVFSIFITIFVLLLLVMGDYNSILLIFITFAIMLIPVYLIFLIIGDVLYHKSRISIKDEGIYQNKRLLKYNNIKEIYIGKMGQIYSFQISPIKDGTFVSKKILLYFYSLEEVYYFIITHDFTYVLSYNYQYNEIASYIKKIISTNGENIHPDYIKFFNEQTTYCQCCGNRTVFKRITNDICPVCFWEDDKDTLYNPNSISEVNHISLGEAKRNYEKYKVSKEDFKEHVRKPFTFEMSDYDKNK